MSIDIKNKGQLQLYSESSSLMGYHGRHSYKVFKNLQTDNIDLSRTLLNNCSLQNCCFTNCKMDSVDYQGTEFDHCIFFNVSFQGADVSSCIFKNCTFDNCMFDSTNFIDNNISLSTIKATEFDCATVNNNIWTRCEFFRFAPNDTSAYSNEFIKCKFIQSGLLSSIYYTIFDRCSFLNSEIDSYILGFQFGLKTKDLKNLEIEHFGEKHVNFKRMYKMMHIVYTERNMPLENKILDLISTDNLGIEVEKLVCLILNSLIHGLVVKVDEIRFIRKIINNLYKENKISLFYYLLIIEKLKDRPILNYSINSLISLKALLTKSMNYAVDNHYIVCSPAVRLKVPKNRIPQIPTRSAPHHYINPEIMQKIFERFPERSSSYIPLKLGYECGLRLGEAFGLCWEDIDFENKVIYINRQVQWYPDKERTIFDKVAKNGSTECGNGYWYFSSPKYNSCRVIEISDELAEILCREKKRQEKAEEYYGVYYRRYYVGSPLSFDCKSNLNQGIPNRIRIQETGYPVHFVCIREDGTFISPRTMQHATRIIKKNICEDFDYHSLRHTHASILAESGAAQKYIQSRLGHANLKTTFDVYEHITDDMRRHGRKIINGVFN